MYTRIETKNTSPLVNKIFRRSKARHTFQQLHAK